MAGSLSIRDFLDLVEASYLAEGGRGITKRVWSLLQIHFGNPKIHFEVWPQRKTGRLELGLHFEGERSQSYDWAERLGAFADVVIAEIGPDAELEEWTASWTRLHQTRAFTALDSAIAAETGRQLALYVSTLCPLLEAAAIPYQEMEKEPKVQAAPRSRFKGRKPRRQILA